MALGCAVCVGETTFVRVSVVDAYAAGQPLVVQCMRAGRGCSLIPGRVGPPSHFVALLIRAQLSPILLLLDTIRLQRDVHIARTLRVARMSPAGVHRVWPTLFFPAAPLLAQRVHINLVTALWILTRSLTQVCEAGTAPHT